MSGVAHDGGGQAPVIPRFVLLGAGAMVAGTIIIAAIGGGHAPQPVAAMIATRTLAFADAPDGAVMVTDMATHRSVARLAPGSNGFIRGTLRAMAHEGGHAAHAAPAHPFVLTAYADHRLTLDDPATGQRLDLEAFGSLNTAAFAALLPAGAGGSK